MCVLLFFKIAYQYAGTSLKEPREADEWQWDTDIALRANV